MGEDELTVGDEVQHKTGGPKMIYTGKSQTGDAICEWFDKGRRQDAFAFSALQRYEAPRAFVGTVGRG